MEIKNYRYLLILGTFTIVTLAVYFWFANSPYFDGFSAWSRGNTVTLVGMLILLKTTGIVWPPLPGGLLTLGSVPIIGWQAAFAADTIGNLLGSSLAYLIGRQWGYSFLTKLFDEPTVLRIKKLKIRKARELEAVVGLRFISGGIFMELLCYACGLLKVKYHNFLISIVVTSALINLPVYIFTESIFETRRLAITLIGVAIAAFFLLNFKGRYLE